MRPLHIPCVPYTLTIRLSRRLLASNARPLIYIFDIKFHLWVNFLSIREGVTSPPSPTSRAGDGCTKKVEVCDKKQKKIKSITILRYFYMMIWFFFVTAEHVIKMKKIPKSYYKKFWTTNRYLQYSI